MHWEQLHAEEGLDRATLREVLSELLGLDPASIEVCDGGGEWGGETQVRAELSTYGGEFPLRIDVHFSAEADPQCTKQALAKALAERGRVRILRDDGSPDPYRRLLVRPDGSEASTLFDADALDNRDAFVISVPTPDDQPGRARPTAPAKKPANDDEIERLLGVFHDAEPVERTQAQERALDELRRLVTERAAPTAIEHALATVRDAFSAEQLAHPFSTVGTIVKAAELALR